MAHLWLADPTSEWVILPLTASEFTLDDFPPRPVTGEADAAGEDPDRAPRLVSVAGGGWAVVTGPDHELRVNGRPLPTGLRVLEDRDELQWPGSGSTYFSTEVLARVGAFPGADSPHACPRCKLTLEKGDAAVKCPQCGVWTHEGATAAGEERRCWTYAETCALCAQKTAADEGFQWTPEGL
jgi:hypothetical protein